MKQKRNKKTRSGSIYILAVTMVLILSLLGIGLLRLGQNARLQAVKDVMQISARSAADAGIEHAVKHMMNIWYASDDRAEWVDNEWYSDTPGTIIGYSLPANLADTVTLDNTYGNARFRYDIYKGTRTKGYRIISTGTAGGVTRTVHSAMVLKSSFFGIGAQNRIYISPNVQLGTVPDGGSFTVQTNSTENNAITLKPNILVPGDVIIGPGGDTDTAVNTAKSVLITGDTKTADDYIEFPPVNRPSYSIVLSELPVPDPINEPNVAEISNASVQIDGGISLKSTLIDTLKIVGDVSIFVNGDTYLSKNTQILVVEGGKLKLYLGGNLMAKPEANITYGDGFPPPGADRDTWIINAAKSISIFGTSGPLPEQTPDCTEIFFQPSNNFYGSIYAPDANITLWPVGDFYGAIVGGDEINLKPGGTFMYVPALMDSSDVEVMYIGVKHGSWWEK